MLSFRNTPSVTVVDNRGLVVRTIDYYRQPDKPEVTDERITHHQHDARGVLARSADPRLAVAGRSNFTYLADLAGTALHTRSVDAGTSITLRDAAGRPFMEVTQVATGDDGNDDLSQAVIRTWQYEAPSQAGRPLSVTEQVADSEARIAERFVWAPVTQQARDHNLLGQVARHYDPAGLAQTNSVALTGVPISTTRQLLKEADHPDIVADWQGEEAAEWDTRLAPEAYTTQTTADATGTMLTTLDAAGNLQRVAYDVAGQLRGSWLTIAGKAEQVIVQSVSYAAAGQKLREVHGNGVVTTYTYEPDTQRLASIKTERQGTGAKVLQDLRYAYDPVGNVLKIRNDAEATRFWRNQKIVPENTYSYDSLYQLASATGREMANAGQPGRHLPHVTPFDNTTYTPYTRTYRYDTAGNLLQIRHSAPATNHNYTTDITISDRSNRAVLSTLAQEPSAVEALFTPGGQQAVLLPGQPLAWTSRAELEQVVSVKREQGGDDRESYRYDSHSQRVLKASAQQTARSTQAQRVIYLPGLELRTHTHGGTLTQDLQVMTVGQAGRAQVRVLHWAAGKPDDLSNDQLRYSYDNLLGSSALEVDGAGNLISHEEYYPFGGTAVWAARNEVEASYKTVRYSGKERDATGLYYYGYRYYQPWVGRWLSADPAGAVDGLNIFSMVRNNPVTRVDDQGLMERDSNARAANGVPVAADGRSAVPGSRTTTAPSGPWANALAWSPNMPRPGEDVRGTLPVPQAPNGSAAHRAWAGPQSAGAWGRPPAPAVPDTRTVHGANAAPQPQASVAVEGMATDTQITEVITASKWAARKGQLKDAVGLISNREPGEKIKRVLAAQGARSTRDIEAVGVDKSTRLYVYIQNAGMKGGMYHVVGRHLEEFHRVGAKSNEQIRELVINAVTKGEHIGTQGTNRPVYSVRYGDQQINVAVSVSLSGYVIGANISEPGARLKPVGRRWNAPKTQ